MLRKMIVAVAVTGVALSAAACNTVKGAGRDITSIGQAGSDAINRR